MRAKKTAQPLLLVDIHTGKQELAEIKKVFDRGWLTMGPATAEFEKKFAQLIGTKYAVATSSGTAALQITMDALELPRGSEIITTPFTWESTTSAIIYAGLKPIFADIEKGSGNISARTIMEKASKKTKGVLVVHYAGWPVEMSAINQLAKQYRWTVIEDSAHALGSKIDSQATGSLGKAGCFSFGSTKTITVGEGGMVTTNDPKIYQRLKVLRNYGENKESSQKKEATGKEYDIISLSYNFKINEVAAAIGVAQLQKLKKIISGRRNALALYYSMLPKIKKAVPLYPSTTLKRYFVVPLFFPLLLSERTASKRLALMKALKKQGIETTIQYPPVYTLKIFRRLLGDLSGSCPVAEDIASRIISLPCHGGVTRSHIKTIIKTIQDTL